MTDIEATLDAGTKQHACPYYASRSAALLAQVVALPYQMLLHRQARESMGISIKGHIVLLDEAHNLVDALSSMYTVQLSAGLIAQAEGQLAQYMGKYQKRLSATNTVRLKELALVLASLKTRLAAAQSAEVMLRVVDFLRELRLDTVNYHTLENFIEESKLAQKLHGFVEFSNAGVKVGVAGNNTGMSWFVSGLC